MVIKQVIVMRHDLTMRKGKCVAQGAHASMMFLLDRMAAAGTPAGAFSAVERAWLDGGRMAKICVRVESEAELLDVVARARAAGLAVHTVTDAGRTEFRGVPTLTCCAIGPDEAERIDAVTGNLRLL